MLDHHGHCSAKINFRQYQSDTKMSIWTHRTAKNDIIQLKLLKVMAKKRHIIKKRSVL